MTHISFINKWRRRDIPAHGPIVKSKEENGGDIACTGVIHMIQVHFNKKLLAQYNLITKKKAMGKMSVLIHLSYLRYIPYTPCTVWVDRGSKYYCTVVVCSDFICTARSSTLILSNRYLTEIVLHNYAQARKYVRRY